MKKNKTRLYWRKEGKYMPRKNNTPRQQINTPDPFDGQPYNLEFRQDGSEVEEPLDVHPMTHTAASSHFEQDDEHHEAGKRDVEMYIRTYNTLLRSSGEISLKALVQAHYNIDSSLHPEARSPYPDMSAFIYSVCASRPPSFTVTGSYWVRQKKCLCNRAIMSIVGKL